MSGEDPREELSWEAFLYVTGELDSRAAERFEEELSRDLRRVDAVSEVVRLLDDLGQLSVSSHQPTRTSKPFSQSPWRRTAVRLVGVAATAAIVLLAVTAWLPRPIETPLASTAPSWSSADLALVWAETHEVLADALADAGWEASDTMMASADDSSEVVGVSEFWDSDDSWIAAAVESMAERERLHPEDTSGEDG